MSPRLYFADNLRPLGVKKLHSYFYKGFLACEFIKKAETVLL